MITFAPDKENKSTTRPGAPATETEEPTDQTGTRTMTTKNNTQKVALLTQGQKYPQTYKLTQHGESLVVETQENIYRTTTTTIPTWWNTEEHETVTPLDTLVEVLNAATIGEDGEKWTDEEFNDEYGHEGTTPEVQKKYHEDYNTIMRATRAAFPNTDLNALLTLAEVIQRSIDYAAEAAADQK